MAKLVNYNTNGSGRDTYISYGNGGFYKPEHVSTEDSFIAISKNHSLPMINSKFALYHTDGSGRDTYIRLITFNTLVRLKEAFIAINQRLISYMDFVNMINLQNISDKMIS